MSLVWDPPAGTSDSYSLERSPNGSDSWAVIYSGASPNFNDSGLSSSTQYYYRVAAVNASGQGSFTATFSGTTGTDSIAPSEPGNLIISNIGTTTADGAWDASTDNIGVTGYRFCLLYTSPSPRDGLLSRMPSSA